MVLLRVLAWAPLLYVLAAYSGIGTELLRAEPQPDPVLTEATSRFVGHDVSVLCLKLPRDMYGWAEPETNILAIRRRDHCKPLHVLAAGGIVVPVRTAIGLVTLAHEG